MTFVFSVTFVFSCDFHVFFFLHAQLHPTFCLFVSSVLLPFIDFSATRLRQHPICSRSATPSCFMTRWSCTCCFRFLFTLSNEIEKLSYDSFPFEVQIQTWKTSFSVAVSSLIRADLLIHFWIVSYLSARHYHLHISIGRDLLLLRGLHSG